MLGLKVIKTLKEALLEVKERSFGYTKGPGRHWETWLWNDDVSNSVPEKCELWKKWKLENTSKEKYPEVMSCLQG